MSNQDLVNLLASATSEYTPEGYKSLQELVKILAQCVMIDDDGNPVIRVKSVE